MFFPRVQLSSLASAALLACAQASYLNNELSFGHNGNISPNLRAVPNFQLLGKPDPPEILSNRVVLTPIAPGNQRGAAWAEKPLLHSYWTVDIDFRATGPERGGGNMQIWYALDGRHQVDTASIYTVGKFDGLVLVVDQYAGSGGFLRGFLNDGNVDYKSHHSVDSLAFGHCQYSYRNLGRPSRIAIQQSAEDFRVSVDGKLCFDSKKVKLPLGYSFGISAASAENPDSFEVFKFVTTTESHTPDVQDPNTASQQQFGGAGEAPNQNQQGNNQDPGAIPAFSDPPEVPAEQIKSQDAQFADLHNRLQAMTKLISAINRDMTHYQANARVESERLAEQISRLESSIARLDALASMERKIDEIKSDVRQTKSDLYNSLDRHVTSLKSTVRDTHHSMLGSLAASAPSVAAYVFVVLGSQALLVVAYVLYKRRKANGPKKYL